MDLSHLAVAIVSVSATLLLIGVCVLWFAIRDLISRSR